MARLAMLALAFFMLGGFAWLTLRVFVHDGLTVGTLVSIFVLLLLGVGIFGALLHRPDR
ncbi:MAG TPA: hypothetical protein VGX16_01245 [Solirubrobacteraceae bacterium]|jgi:hypothetical protein|nr:hypothetical protein [Solirubrobacteraceae bacterium]